MTTLSILAPLLPYTPEVEYTSGSGHVFRCLLIGLNKSHARVMHLDTSISRVQYQSVGIQDLTPVLCSFDQLCTPLEDGTVPAVEVARLLGREAEREYDLVAGENTRGKCIELHFDGSYRGTLLEEWETTGQWSILKVADYLRSKQFAVGLSSEQYIRKES